MWEKAKGRRIESVHSVRLKEWEAIVHGGSTQRRWPGVKGHGGAFMGGSKGSEGAVAPGYA